MCPVTINMADFLHNNSLFGVGVLGGGCWGVTTKLPGLVCSVTVEVTEFLHSCSLSEVGVVTHRAGLLDVTLLHINDGAWVLAVQQVAYWQVI